MIKWLSGPETGKGMGLYLIQRTLYFSARGRHAPRTCAGLNLQSD